jgi:hypothetical protein
MDYDGNKANIDVKMKNNGKRKHINVELSNNDLEELFHIPSVQAPLHTRLHNDFLVPAVIKKKTRKNKIRSKNRKLPIIKRPKTLRIRL